MRSFDYNVQQGIAMKYPVELLLSIFERMCLVSYFELGVIDAVEKKEITYPVYLSSGQESVAAALSTEIRNYLIFAQHRAHDIFLTFGGPPEMLRDELLGLPTGTSKGKAGSNCLQYHENGISMFGHHGLIGENVPQGVGAALGTGKSTVCIFGDGAAEEDYVLAAMGFAVTHRLPVLFVCMDNDLSILTKTETRRSWKITEISEAFGIPSVDVADDPWSVLHNVQTLTKSLPALINCRVCRMYWHVGAGTDGSPEWDRLGLVREDLINLGLERQIKEIEARTKDNMEKVWERKLSQRP